MGEPDDDDGVEGRFRHLFSVIDEGYCLGQMVVDDDGRPVDYVFLETNQRFEEMTGLVGAAGRSARSLVPDLEQRWIDTYARAGLGRERIRFQQGSEAMGRWFDVFTMPMPGPGRFAIVFKDDTARRRAEQAFRTERGELRDEVARERADSLRLQHALLPAHIVQHPGLPICAEYRAAVVGDHVGGDWYDTFAWPDGRVGVMVGDVVGHSLEAAVKMGSLRSGVAALARRVGPDAVELIEALEECVTAPGGAEFVTAAVAVIDPAGGTVSYCSAGHPPAMVVDQAGAVTWLDTVQTPPLGPGLRRPRRGGQVAMAEGSTLVMYSDGLVERRGEAIDEGLGRLGRAASAAAGASFDDVCPRILDAALSGSDPTDDIVLVAVRRTADDAGNVSAADDGSGRSRVHAR